MKSFSSKIALLIAVVALSFGSLAAAPTTSETTRSWLVQFVSRSILKAGDVVTANISAAVALPAEVRLDDQQGNAIWKKDIQLKAGDNSLRFRLADLSAGSYTLTIATAEGDQARNIVIR
jgi:hypothetical protein